ncbi:uncharacterized protein [Nicotiana tomentosiformis]|uniref:uncharacterized protein n=1 Tax=Nicotiana tomentosiformis TaxID=4098 RepID=UPI00388C724B
MGVKSKGAFQRLKKLIKRHKVTCIALHEPFVDKTKLNHYRSKLGFPNAIANSNGKIWIFWDNDYTCNVISNKKQQITMEVNHSMMQIPFWITIVYAKTNTRRRKNLWKSINNTSNHINGPWSIEGDFNVIMDANEKKGGRIHRLSKIMDFIKCMKDCDMADAGYTVATVTHLPRTWSDHSVLLYQYTKSDPPLIKYFRFLNFWLDQPDFDHVVKDCWETQVQGNVMYTLRQKLKKLTHCLGKWSKESIDNVFDKVEEREKKVKDLEIKYEQDDCASNRINLYLAYAQQIKWMNMQDSILRQKANIKWEEESDSNSKYFHSVIRQKRKRSFLHIIKNEHGQWIQGNEKIVECAISHFNNLFSQTYQNNDMDFLKRIDSTITWEDNLALLQLPSDFQ